MEARSVRADHRPVEQSSRTSRRLESPTMLPSTGFEAYLLDQVQAAVTATDLAGAVTHWNQAAETMFGWSRTEALGRDVRDLIMSTDDLGRANDIRAAVLTGQNWEGEFPIRRKN